ncbi:MAG: acyl-CoA/acyl-ACP dehydrogenase [Fimbriimonadaceae bacterium]|nr:acyl-CoA/acyl-ACP dehydrogenase [Fimbriimonadaceae bacterium]
MASVTETETLGRAVAFLEEVVRPSANTLDDDPEALRPVLAAMGERRLMALRLPQAYGGPEVSEPQFRAFQEEAARASGAFAFLQTQHQSAASMIAKGAPDEFKARYLPGMDDGTRTIGIGFSQLRRSGPPVLTAAKVTGGYRLNGTAPWVTGHSFFREFLVGASLPDGEAVFGVVPFADTEQGGGTVRCKGPMRLAAMEAAMTMVVEFRDWLLPDEAVAFVKPQGWIQNNDMINVSLQASFAIGCARAGLDLLWQAYEKKGLEFVKSAWTDLDAEHRACKALADDQGLPREDRLRARVWAIDMAARCTHAAVAAHSGQAAGKRHDAQRLYREAMVYTVSAQTSDVMEGTLRRLVARAGGHA